MDRQIDTAYLVDPQQVVATFLVTRAHFTWNPHYPHFDCKSFAFGGSNACKPKMRDTWVPSVGTNNPRSNCSLQTLYSSLGGIQVLVSGNMFIATWASSQKTPDSWWLKKSHRGKLRFPQTYSQA